MIMEKIYVKNSWFLGHISIEKLFQEKWYTSAQSHVRACMNDLYERSQPELLNCIQQTCVSVDAVLVNFVFIGNFWTFHTTRVTIIDINQLKFEDLRITQI